MRARPACEQLEADHAQYGIKGVKLYTAEWKQRLARLEADRPGGAPVPRQVRRARDQEPPRPQGPDDLAAGQGRVRRLRHRPRRDRLPGRSTSSSSTSACRGSRTSASWRRRSATSTPASPSSSAALMHARPQFFAKVMGELLFWLGEDKMMFGSDYAIWEPKWQVEGFVDWEMPDDDGVRGLPAAGRRGQEEDPRAQRREALRRRGAGGVPRSPVPAEEPASPDSAVEGAV